MARRRKTISNKHLDERASQYPSVRRMPSSFDDETLRAYAVDNVVPILAEIAFVVAAALWPDGILYSNLAFYLLLIVYYATGGSYSITQLGTRLSTSRFWKSILFAIGCIAVGYTALVILERLLPSLPTGEVLLPIHRPLQMALFALETIVMPPLAEEMFYRRHLIILDRGYGALVASAIFSSVLFALAHAFAPFCVALYALLGIAFSLAYVRCRDIHAMIAAHLVVNVLFDGITIVQVLRF